MSGFKIDLEAYTKFVSADQSHESIQSKKNEFNWEEEVKREIEHFEMKIKILELINAKYKTSKKIDIPVHVTSLDEEDDMDDESCLFVLKRLLRRSKK